MKLTVPTTFTSAFLERLRAINDEHRGRARVFEIYGSFQHGAFNSARPAKYLPRIDREQFQAHVAAAADIGISFNYLINAPCYANVEYDAQGRRALDELLEFLVAAKVAAVTVTVPYIAEIISRCHPDLEVVVSTIAYVDTMRGIEQLARAGARRIVLNVDANRDFAFLRRATRLSPVPLEVIANPVCLYQCQYKHNHYAVAGHGSQNDGINCGRPYNQFYLNWCFLQKLAAPAEFMRSPWLRPEDLSLWREAGIDYFKLAGRGQGDEDIAALCRAYMAERFTGDLLSLMGWPHWLAFRKGRDGTLLPPLEISVDNSALDGFLQFFADKTPACRLGCQGCGHCQRWVEKAVRVNDPGLLAAYVRHMEDSLATLVRHAPTSAESAELRQRWQEAAARQVVA